MTALGCLAGWPCLVCAGLGWFGLGWAAPSAWLGLADELAGCPDGLGWLVGVGQAPERGPRRPKRTPKWSPKRVVFIPIWMRPFEDHLLLT